MKFYTENYENQNSLEHKDIIILVHSSWDDWFAYNTLYILYYYNKDGEEIRLGSVKIGQKGMKSGQRMPNLLDTFETLTEDFFSLGQDISFYENLNKIGIDFREEVLNALNDIAYNDKAYNIALNENVTKISLLRSVSQTSVEGEYRRLTKGDSQLTEFGFKFHAPLHEKSLVDQMILEFNVKPKSNPPTNVNVIIGRNGVGKTHLFNNMISALLNGNKVGTKYGYFTDKEDVLHNPFSNIISVSFSAFDETNPIIETRDKTKSINYSYIGLKREKKGRELMPPKSPVILKNEFIKSIKTCHIQGKKNRWIDTLKTLETDPIFKEAQVSKLADGIIDDNFKEKASTIFNKLSSGHKIVLLTVTELVEKIEERSLVLLDEPEGYLHPPLLSAFIRALSDLLIKRNAVAIIGTHSPVVLQEVPRKSAWKIRRHGANAIAERLEIESFGENVGLLTQEIFGLEVTDSGFHNILKEISSKYKTYSEAIETLDNQLGMEGKAILRTLMHSK
ncbi:AAA family ATPase [Labilibaculum euxinus]|uniref:AAA family ATPase n=1 Tax=Labilibaculum euxinus TaxID=2686357 RepID=A0A7M4D7F9_9BACT|nr:AAA family ATPase [Labilibaculum euxinus]MUP38588.1 AAA family ATPase [Labilibaculum euxinus]MVB07793.1 AAA family ATPase [Labilibaculum euxinus]